MSVVYALATPPAKSAICIFRVSGDGCHKSLKKIFSRNSFTPNRFYVEILLSKKGPIDKVGVVVFKGPKSYTGEDSFEVHAHGGLAVMSEIVDLFRGLGFDEAAGGEFTKRAFLNNKITLDEAEAVSDVIESTDRRGVVLSNSVLFGGFSEKIDERTGEYFSDIYTTKLDKKDKWSRPVLVPDPISVEGGEGSAYVNNRGTVMFFTKCKVEKGRSLGCSIYISERKGKLWSNPMILHVKIDSNTTIGHPAVSSDESLVIFYSYPGLGTLATSNLGIGGLGTLA